jgi:hypothetical protein
MGEWIMKIRLADLHKILDRIDLCGCGTDAHWEIVLRLLKMAENHDKNGSFYGVKGTELAPWIEFGAKVIDGWGLIEHGTGIGWAWLTEDGELLLAWLRKFGTDTGDDANPVWPEGSLDCGGCPCGCENLVFDTESTASAGAERTGESGKSE